MPLLYALFEESADFVQHDVAVQLALRRYREGRRFITFAQQPEKRRENPLQHGKRHRPDIVVLPKEPQQLIRKPGIPERRDLLADRIPGGE